MVPREGTTHLILTHPMTLLDLPRSKRCCTSYGVTIDPTRGSLRLKTRARCPTLVQGVSQSRVVRLRHNLISNSLNIILSQWMLCILVFYHRVGPMHHPRQQVLNLVL